jgi:hypothetical protein
LKSTVPVGLDPVTVAVSVTDWPTVDGLSEDPSPVVVVAWTVWVSGEEVLPWLSVSPP